MIKKGKLIGVILMSALLIPTTMALTSCGNSDESKTTTVTESTDKKIARLLDDAQKRLAKGDFTQALENVKTVLSIDSKNTTAEALSGQIGAYQLAKTDFDAQKFDALQKDLTDLENMKSLNPDVKYYTEKIANRYAVIKQAQKYFADAQQLFTANQYDAAGGNIANLLALKSDDEAVVSLQTQAKDLKVQIESAQKAAAAQQTLLANSKYATERQSKVIGEAYLKATGKAITSSSDAEIKAYLDGIKQTTEDSNQQILNAFLLASGIKLASNDQAFVTKDSTDLYSIEIRTNSTDEQISNLKGLYHFVPSTKAVTQMNYLSGEYETYPATSTPLADKTAAADATEAKDESSEASGSSSSSK